MTISNPSPSPGLPESRRRSLIKTFGFAALLSLSARTLLLPWPETFEYGAEFGELVAIFSAAYISAWIFHYLVVEKPRRQAAADAYQAITWKLYMYVATADILMRQFHEAAGREFDGSVDYGTFAEMMDTLKPSSNPTAAEAMESTLTLLSAHAANYDKMLPLLPYLDPSVSIAIRHVGTSKLHETVEKLHETIKKMPPGSFFQQIPSSLAYMAHPLYDFWQLSRRLHVLLLKIQKVYKVDFGFAGTHEAIS